MHTLALLVAGTTCFSALCLMGCALSYGAARLWLTLSRTPSAARQAGALLGAILLPFLIAGGLAAHATWTAATCSLVEQERGLVGPCVHATRHICAHVSEAIARLTQGAAWGGFVLAAILVGIIALIVVCSVVQSRCRPSRWTPLPPSRKLRAAIAQVEVGSSLRFSETSHDVPGAALVGWFKPRCFVAQSLVKDATTAELCVALRHEIAHALRRDNLARVVVNFCRKLLFFFPPAQWLCREWEKQVEFACDDAAVRTPQDALRLASVLVKACRSTSRIAAPTTALIGEWSTVEQRVRRLVRQSKTQDVPSRISPSVSLPLGLFTAALLLIFVGILAASFDLSLHCAVETLARLVSV
jgi:beta-lactamase regulating signal transducer with metallopeptidase domain